MIVGELVKIRYITFRECIKNLVHLWMGKFKGLNTGTEDYVIPDHIWKDIGLETVDAVRTVPSAFVQSLGNIVEDQLTYTAEAWGFWFMFIAPILLQGRFQKGLYYTHFCDLVDIMKTCTQFSITHAEINDLEEKIIQLVGEYER